MGYSSLDTLATLEGQDQGVFVGATTPEEYLLLFAVTVNRASGLERYEYLLYLTTWYKSEKTVFEDQERKPSKNFSGQPANSLTL